MLYMRKLSPTSRTQGLGFQEAGQAFLLAEKLVEHSSAEYTSLGRLVSVDNVFSLRALLKCEGMTFFLRGHPTPANLREIQAERPEMIQVLTDDPSFIVWCNDADIETLRRLELDESIDYAFGWIEPSVGVDWGQALLKHCSQLLSLERSVEVVELPWEGAFLMLVLHDTGGYFAPRSTEFVHYISEPAEVTESDASGEGRRAEDFLV